MAPTSHNQILFIISNKYYNLSDPIVQLTALFMIRAAF